VSDTTDIRYRLSVEDAGFTSALKSAESTMSASLRAMSASLVEMRSRVGAAAEAYQKFQTSMLLKDAEAQVNAELKRLNSTFSTLSSELSRIAGRDLNEVSASFNKAKGAIVALAGGNDKVISSFKAFRKEFEVNRIAAGMTVKQFNELYKSLHAVDTSTSTVIERMSGLRRAVDLAGKSFSGQVMIARKSRETLRDLTRHMSLLGTVLRTVKAGFSSFSEVERGLAMLQRTVSKFSGSNVKSVASFASAIRKIGIASGYSEKELALLVEQYMKLGLEMNKMTFGKLAQLPVLMATTQKKMTGAAKGARDFGKAMTFARYMVRRIVSAIGVLLAFKVSAWLRSIVGDSIRTSASFEKLAIKITALTHNIGSSFDSIKGKLRLMASEVAKGPEELADGLYYISSAGIKGAEAMDLLRKAAMASSVGLGDIGSIARTATAALNAYADSGMTADRAISTMISTVREGNMVASQLGNVIGTILPVASKIGVSFEDVGASLAIMTKHGMNASKAATAIRRLLLGIRLPTRTARKEFKAMGVDLKEVDSILRDQGLIEAFAYLDKKTRGDIDAIDRLIQNLRALVPALVLVKKKAGNTAESFKHLRSEMSGQAEKAFAEGTGTVSRELDKISASYESLKTSFGEAFAHVFGPVLDNVLKKLDKMNEAYAENQTAVDRVANRTVSWLGWLVGSAGLALLISRIKKAEMATVALGEAFRSMAISESLMANLGRMRSLLSSPGSLAIGVVVGEGVAMLADLYAQLDHYKQKIDSTGAAVQNLLDYEKSLGRSVRDTLNVFGVDSVDALTDYVNAVRTGAEADVMMSAALEMASNWAKKRADEIAAEIKKQKEAAQAAAERAEADKKSSEEARKAAEERAKAEKKLAKATKASWDSLSSAMQGGLTLAQAYSQHIDDVNTVLKDMQKNGMSLEESMITFSQVVNDAFRSYAENLILTKGETSDFIEGLRQATLSGKKLKAILGDTTFFSKLQRFLDSGGTWANVFDALGLSVSGAKEQFDNLAKSGTALTDIQKKHSKVYTAFVRELVKSGGEISNVAEIVKSEYVAALKESVGEQLRSSERLKDLRRQFEEMARSGYTLAKVFDMSSDSVIEFLGLGGRVNDLMRMFGINIDKTKQRVLSLSEELEAYFRTLPSSLASAMVDRGFGGLVDALEDVGKHLGEKFFEALFDVDLMDKQFKETLDSMKRGLQEKLHISNESVGKAAMFAGGLSQAYGLYTAIKGGKVDPIQGIMSGASSGASIGSAFGAHGAVVGAVIGAVVGLIGSMFSHNKKYRFSGDWGADGFSSSMSEHISSSTVDSMIGSLNQAVYTIHSSFLDMIEMFDDDSLLLSDSIRNAMDDFDGSFYIEGENYSDVLQQFIAHDIPRRMQNVMHDAMVAGFRGLGLGANSAFFDRLFSEADTLVGDAYINFFMNTIKAMVAIRDAIKDADFDGMDVEASLGAFEALTKGVGEAFDKIDLIQARMGAEMTVEDQAKDVQRIADIISETRKAEIEMLKHIKQLQESITDSLSKAKEDLSLRGASDADAGRLYASQLSSYFNQIADALNPDDVKASFDNAMQYIGNLTGMFSDEQLLEGVGQAFRDVFGTSGSGILAQLAREFDISTIGLTAKEFFQQIYDALGLESQGKLDEFTDQIREWSEQLQTEAAATALAFTGLTDVVNVAADAIADLIGYVRNESSDASTGSDGRVATGRAGERVRIGSSSWNQRVDREALVSDATNQFLLDMQDAIRNILDFTNDSWMSILDRNSIEKFDMSMRDAFSNLDGLSAKLNDLTISDQDRLNLLGDIGDQMQNIRQLELDMLSKIRDAQMGVNDQISSAIESLILDGMNSLEKSIYFSRRLGEAFDQLSMPMSPEQVQQAAQDAMSDIAGLAEAIGKENLDRSVESAFAGLPRGQEWLQRIFNATGVTPEEGETARQFLVRVYDALRDKSNEAFDSLTDKITSWGDALSQEAYGVAMSLGALNGALRSLLEDLGITVPRAPVGRSGVPTTSQSLMPTASSGRSGPGKAYSTGAPQVVVNIDGKLAPLISMIDSRIAFSNAHSRGGWN